MLLFLQSCSFLQKTSSCSFCHRRKSLTDDAMTVIVTRKLCATQVFFTSLAIADVATPEMWAGAAEELHVAVFLDACFSMLHVLINQDGIYTVFQKIGDLFDILNNSVKNECRILMIFYVNGYKRVHHT